jgi:hypothetical protein
MFKTLPLSPCKFANIRMNAAHWAFKNCTSCRHYRRQSWNPAALFDFSQRSSILCAAMKTRWFAMFIVCLTTCFSVAQTFTVGTATAAPDREL